MEANNGVHRTHCCALHGCKYGDADCPVELEHVEQDYPCEMCPDLEEAEQNVKYAQQQLDFLENLNYYKNKK